jgi:pullulanase/glycogen debranching enzyme
MPPYSSFDCENTTILTYPGSSHPLGAFYDGHGINFAIYSEYATKVYLCLFRRHDDESEFIEYARINIKGCRTVSSVSLVFNCFS